MKFRLPIIIILVIMFAGIGCSLKLGKRTNSKTYYVLQDPGSGKTRYRKRPLSLLLEETTAPALVSNSKIVFSRTPDTRSFYQYAYWSETPPRFFTCMLLNRLETSGLFTAVCRRPTVVHTDLQLSIELIEFYHDVSSQPGFSRIKLRTQLFDSRQKAIIDQQYFTHAAAAPTYDAQGAVQGFSQAAGLILDDIVTWLAQKTK